MKSTERQLESRGFASDKLEKEYENKSVDELHCLLKSNSAMERTLCARMISKHKYSKSIEYLCLALESEKKLYTKIEICNSIISFGQLAVPHLIKMVGKIGKNQHKVVEKRKFKKKSYPLPRDIASRTIIRIGKVALPDLCKVLQTDEILKISEAVDAIGFICFYDKQEKYLQPLVECYNKNINNELVKWKIIRAMSAFPESFDFLNNLNKQEKNERIKCEVERSLSLLNY